MIPSTSGGQSIELPFVVVSAGDVADEQLSNAEIDQAAMAIANQFLQTFQHSDAARRQGFGAPSDIFLTSVVLVQVD